MCGCGARVCSRWLATPLGDDIETSTDKDALIGQLRIDRDAQRPKRPRGGGSGGLLWWIVAGLALLAIVGLAAWWMIAQPGRIPVKAATAQAASASDGASGASLLDATGYVVARREATVSSKVTGQVAEVMVEEGQMVQEGQVIARLDPSNARAALAQSAAQVSQAEANVRLAQAALNDANIKYGRYQGLAGQGVVAAQAIDDAKTQVDSAREQLAVDSQAVGVARAGLGVAQRSLDDTVVRAPFTGVVTAKSAQPGEIVAPVAGGGFTRTGICTIVDMDSLEVDVDVAESFINRVAQGMPTSIRLDAYPDWDIPGSVIAVIPTADRSKATVTVRVGMNTKDARVVPDMGARVSFLTPKATGAALTRRGVIVPTDAVETGNGDNTGVVYVIANGRAERRAVRLGARESAGQVLLSGVSPGDEVAEGDFSQLHDGAKVRVTGQDQPSS